MTVIISESKKPGAPARAAFDENLTCYKADIPQLFWFNALLIARPTVPSSRGLPNSVMLGAPYVHGSSSFLRG